MDNAWEQENSKPEKYSKMPPTPTRQVHDPGDRPGRFVSRVFVNLKFIILTVGKLSVCFQHRYQHSRVSEIGHRRV